MRFVFELPICLVDFRVLDVDVGVAELTGFTLSGSTIGKVFSPSAMGGNSVYSFNTTNSFAGWDDVRILDICFPGGAAGAVTAVAFCIDDEDLR